MLLWLSSIAVVLALSESVIVIKTSGSAADGSNRAKKSGCVGAECNPKEFVISSVQDGQGRRLVAGNAVNSTSFLVTTPSAGFCPFDQTRAGKVLL